MFREGVRELIINDEILKYIYIYTFYFFCVDLFFAYVYIYIIYVDVFYLFQCIRTA